MTIAESAQTIAAQKVSLFQRQFGDEYRLLAYHAALPLVLTPELVHYLRTEFLLDREVPWEAEADLLLSDLCSQVGYELYAMDTDVRSYLLEEMQQDERIPPDRMSEVARVLISYVAYLSRVNPEQREQELQAQRWAAMTYLGEAECRQVVEEIIAALSESGSQGSSNAVKAEFARLARITETLSAQLSEYPELLKFAQDVDRSLRDPTVIVPRDYAIGDSQVTIPWIDVNNSSDFYYELIHQQYEYLKEVIANDFENRGYEIRLNLHPREIDELNIDKIEFHEVDSVENINYLGLTHLDETMISFDIMADVIFSVNITILSHEQLIREIHEDTGYPTINGRISNQSISIAILNEKHRSFFFSLRSLRLCGSKDISTKILLGLKLS